MSGRESVVAEALAKHRFDWNRLACCETVPLADRNDIAGWHRAHVAAAVLQALDTRPALGEDERAVLTDREVETLKDACNLSHRSELVLNVRAVVEQFLAARAHQPTPPERLCWHRFPDGTECRLSSEAHDMPGMQHHRDTTPPEQAEAVAAVERVRALTWAMDDGTEYEHNGHGANEGEPECPGCWVMSIRAALTPTAATQVAAMRRVADDAAGAAGAGGGL